jgi:hypothetical protein
MDLNQIIWQKKIHCTKKKKKQKKEEKWAIPKESLLCASLFCLFVCLVSASIYSLPATFGKPKNPNRTRT